MRAAQDELQPIEEINAIVGLRTGWIVEEALSPSKIAFLKVFGPDGAGGRTFLTSLPRSTDADVICSFAEACRHYYRMGAADAGSKVVLQALKDQVVV